MSRIRASSLTAWVRTKVLIRAGGEQCTRGCLTHLTNQVVRLLVFCARIGLSSGGCACGGRRLFVGCVLQLGALAMSTAQCERHAREIESSESISECADHGLSTWADGCPIIYDISEDGSMTIKSDDLRRVRILHSDGSYHVLREVVSSDEAAAFVAAYNASHEEKCEAVDYQQAFREARAVEALAARRGLV